MIIQWSLLEIMVLIFLFKNFNDRERVEAFVQRFWGSNSSTKGPHWQPSPFEQLESAFDPSSLSSGPLSKMNKKQFNHFKNRMTVTLLEAKSKKVQEFNIGEMAAEWTSSSLDHLLAKHGHIFGVNDRLPNDGSGNNYPGSSEFTEVRTRLNKANRKSFFDNVLAFCRSGEVERSDNVIFRGKPGHRAFFETATSKIVIFAKNPETQRWAVQFALKLSNAQATVYRELRTVKN